jgi:pyruvate kinase
MSERVACQLYLSWAVSPLVMAPCKTVPDLIESAVTQLVAQDKLKKGDQVVVVAGEPLGQSGMVNLVEVQRV